MDNNRMRPVTVREVLIFDSKETPTSTIEWPATITNSSKNSFPQSRINRIEYCTVVTEEAEETFVLGLRLTNAAG